MSFATGSRDKQSSLNSSSFGCGSFSDLHWRLGVVVVVQEGRQPLNDGVWTGDLLWTSSRWDWWFSHDLSVA